MNKKLIVFILVFALIASVFLTGCTFIKVNDERKATDVLATVSLEYEGQTMTLDVSRNELISYVNYIIQLYSAYGLSYDVSTIVEQGLDSLINQKYLILQGMTYLMSLDHRQGAMYMNTDEYKALYGDVITAEGVLTIAERYASIASTNESFITSIETYISEYETEQRELAASTARERLAALYSDGYSVKEDGTAVYHLDGDEYVEGLYQTSFIYDSSVTVEVDYTYVYLQITLEKSNADDEVVYLPVSSTAVTTAEDEDADFVSNYITAKICSVTYDEPVVDDDGEESYKTHTAEAEFTLVTPRTAYTEAEEEDDRDEATLLTEGSVKYRYSDFSGELTEEMAQIVADGQIFEHTLETYASDAEKEAYRQFREAKKALLIGFDSSVTDDAYNTLGYYYLSGFESAVLTAVQHELKRAALTENPVSDEDIAAEYEILVNKQREEYEILSAQEQVEKFASTIGTDLTSCYYIPIDALLSESFTYEYVDENGNTQTFESTYAIDNGDGTYTINMFYIAHILFKWTDDLTDEMSRYLTDRSDEETKEIKTQFLEYLKTNKSKLEYATADEQGTTLEDAFFVNEDGTIAEFSVLEVLAELNAAMADSDDPLALFQEYMTYFNDDSGTMSSALGYFIALGDISHSYDGDDFPNMAKNLYISLLESGVNPNGAKAISAYAFTSYGLHIEYISFAPFYGITLQEGNTLGTEFALDLEGSTFAETIKDALESRVESDAYSNWSANYSSDDALEHTEKYTKKINTLLSDLGL